MRKKINLTRGRYISLFIKSVVALIAIGILPLMIMGLAIYNVYLESIKDIILSNMYRTTRTIGKNIQDLLGEMEENTKYLYSYEFSGDGYLYEIMEDSSITENKKNRMITDALRNILYMDQYIDHVFFVTKEEEIYSAMRLPEKVVDEEGIQKWHEKYFDKESKTMGLIPTHISDYYMGSEKEDFSVSRNIMSTKTIQSADQEVLGTLYIDLSTDYLYNIINETKLEEGSEVYIVDRKNRAIVYEPYLEKKGIKEWKQYLKYMDSEHQYMKVGADYFIYSLVPGTDWLVVQKIPSANMESSFQRIRNLTLLVMGISVAFLIFVYYEYSKKTNRPIKDLKNAMESIQKGNLDTRVQIQSNDEIGFLAKGLNSMTEKLQSHIKKVYIAEIRQKEAEIEALKTQIQPHYLYNTLDVIRMKAIMNDDQETAQMIDGLSGQLKYLIGGAKDMVTLQAEIDSVRNYFKIIQIRYENRFSLEIDMERELLDFCVPQLILQPVVENAVKHGLKPKSGEGVVAIQGKVENNTLEITVMDNGIGMDAERLEYVKTLLENEETVNHPKSKRASIGIKNVYDRIKLIFGEEYDISISSFQGIGTIVKYRLPIIETEECRREERVSG